MARNVGRQHQLDDEMARTGHVGVAQVAQNAALLVVQQAERWQWHDASNGRQESASPARVAVAQPDTCAVRVCVPSAR